MEHSHSHNHPTKPENLNAQVFWLVMGLALMFLGPLCFLLVATTVIPSW